MRKSKFICAAGLSVLLLASCGRQQAATAENAAAVDPETNALGNAGPSDPGRPAAPGDNGVGTVPPPDAVSHPDGYLPDAAEPPPPSGPEPTAADPSGSKAPATEDEYIRNEQAGR